jgi:hypothetical protein
LRVRKTVLRVAIAGGMAVNASLLALLTERLPVGPMQVSQAAPLAALTQASFVREWQQGPFTQDKGAPIAESSPMVATLDGRGPSVVVGDRSGYLYAFHLSDGSAVTGWPVNDGGPPIDSTPSVATFERRQRLFDSGSRRPLWH